MSEHLRSLIAGFKKGINRIKKPSERQVNLPVEITLEMTHRIGSPVVINAKPVVVNGCTASVDKTGLSFVVPFIRVGEHYLVSHGEQKGLKIRLELPNGTVRMSVASERFEMIMLHDSVQQYLIGAKITQINSGDQERYEHFLKHGGKTVANEESTIKIAAQAKKSMLSGFLSLF